MARRSISRGLLGLALVAPLAGCDVDVKDPGKMPEVQVTPGEAPNVDVRGPDVDVKTEEKTVTVPTDVDVKTEEKAVTVPDIDVNLPKENETPPADGE